MASAYLYQQQFTISHLAWRSDSEFSLQNFRDEPEAFIDGLEGGVWTSRCNCGNLCGAYPVCRHLLPLSGKVVTADAMHTQVAHAIYLKEQKNADYFFTVKGNQGTLLASIESLDDEDFSP